MGKNLPKQFLTLRDKPVLAYTLEFFEKISPVNEIILVTGNDYREYVKSDIVEKYQFHKVKKIVIGGDKRQDSVYQGIIHCDDRAEVILVHDAARPFPPREGVEEGIESALRGKGGVLGISVTDTIKKTNPEGNVIATLNRDELISVQTPQIFPAELLKIAFEKAIRDNFTGTDEASVMEYAGFPVTTFPGSRYNIKLTVPEDITFGESIAAVLNKGDF
jgi:2-C-methyl-D-erythritol 4-phosphate cytidylyltransferase